MRISDVSSDVCSSGLTNSSAVRVAAFSLYIALLEQSSPSDLPKLIKAGKLLPPLYGKTLLPGSDFFSIKDAPLFDVIVGNPPWNGRTGQLTTAQDWTSSKGRSEEHTSELQSLMSISYAVCRLKKKKRNKKPKTINNGQVIQ